MKAGTLQNSFLNKHNNISFCEPQVVIITNVRGRAPTLHRTLEAGKKGRAIVQCGQSIAALSASGEAKDIAAEAGERGNARLLHVKQPSPRA